MNLELTHFLFDTSKSIAVDRLLFGIAISYSKAHIPCLLLLFQDKVFFVFQH